ncbi:MULTISPECIES: PIN domain-containing protein [Capnocytophaga]|jgi:hypothetical protein|uniref:PIN domain-containing protein n=1 Tax=Capnocytophaga TaxID=1016 RepID=UPI00027C4430|nr:MULTISPECIES: PIN domain-containing protein [Capnocytophaga]EJU34612.1 PIN domain protein [Capnocytophaga sp. CM59]
MIVIADSNIFFASLITPNGEIATILKDKNMQFLAPDYMIEEVKDHIDIIQKKRKKNKTKRQISVDLDLLLKNITIIPLEELSNKNIQKAFSIVKDVDEDDYAFIAMHLQYKHKIWSRDEELINGLTERGYGHFFISTDEVRKHLYKKKK